MYQNQLITPCLIEKVFTEPCPFILNGLSVCPVWLQSHVNRTKYSEHSNTYRPWHILCKFPITRNYSIQIGKAHRTGIAFESKLYLLLLWYIHKIEGSIIKAMDKSQLFSKESESEVASLYFPTPKVFKKSYNTLTELSVSSKKEVFQSFET